MISIRNGMWETNSSSVHTFTVDKYSSTGYVFIPKEIELKYISFGWEWETYNTLDEKVTYILICIEQSPDPRMRQYRQLLIDFLASYGCTISNLDTFKFGLGETLHDPDSYVDHGVEHLLNLIPILEDKDQLYRFLFLPSSTIDTGNDNDY